MDECQCHDAITDPWVIQAVENIQTRRVLLVIDVQQDFTSSEGPLKKNYVRVDHILSNLRLVLPSFRAQNGRVIWIKSDYSKTESEPKYLARPAGKEFEDIPMNDALLSNTHISFPMCIPGQTGAEFVDEIKVLVNEDNDQIICKTYFSAFTGTALVDRLKDVQEVHICGLTTNRCVLATTTDAFFHGYKVFLWADCLGYRSQQSHDAALEKIARWYATVITAVHYFKRGRIRSS